MQRKAGFALVAALLAIVAPAASARVLRVGTYHGVKGQYSSIQAAVNAAKPGDFILIGPGDYKTSSSSAPKGAPDSPAGILITKPRIYVRGMNRNTVIVDGTKPGSPRCATSKPAQNFGPTGKKGALGLNGIMVWKAGNVWVQNLTVCNFLGGSGDAGNEVWWNGGDGSGKIGGHGYLGSYLTATSTFFGGEKSAAQYGIFSSNWTGGTWEQSYVSNFNDSGLYIGACQHVCDQTIDHAWAEFNALGYSGSNSGGWMLIENSRFDNNEDGFDTNSQNGDEPSPQNGACPAGVQPPVAGASSCWVLTHNLFDHNNNPNVPSAGSAAAGPYGTGMSLSGARNDSVIDNTFESNGAWGAILVPYPDSGKPCTGGVLGWIGAGSCLFDESGNALLDNTFVDNGYFGNPTNGDFALVNLEPGPTNCFSGNVEQGGGAVVSTPSDAEQVYPTCNGQTVDASANTNSQSGTFQNEALCDSRVSLSPGSRPPCTPTDHYPRPSKIVMHPLPKHLATMPNPCVGVPANPWCRAKQG
ncbi:MAG TPA: hypothetical protein VGF91_24880 [Solirubrobacteraceae bacterium]|jgi:hypothetical protein